MRIILYSILTITFIYSFYFLDINNNEDSIGGQAPIVPSEPNIIPEED